MRRVIQAALLLPIGIGTLFLPGSTSGVQPYGTQPEDKPAPARVPAKGNGVLRITPPQELDFRPGKMVRIDADGADDFTWDYEVTGGKMEDIDFDPTPKQLAFPMPAPGVSVRIVAAAVKDGRAAIVKTYVTIKGGPPVLPMQQEKGPAAPNPIKNFRIVFKGREGVNGTPLGQLIASKSLRDGLAQRGIELRDAVDVDDKDPAVKALRMDRVYAATKAPAMVLQDAAGNLIPDGRAFPLKLGGDVEANVKTLLQDVDTIARETAKGQ